MDTAEAIPSQPVRAPELAAVFQADGPFATVSLGTEGAIDNAARLSEARWKSLRTELADAGAPPEVLEGIDGLVPDAHQQGERLFAVANPHGVLHVEHGPGPDDPDLATWAALPSLQAVIRWRQQRLPHVVVVADRTGADIAAVRVSGPDIEKSVEGDDSPITKVHAGGWSQRRYQQRAENTWERNAKDVADKVTDLAGRVGATLVVAAGDERALALLQESLPDDLQVHVVSGSRTEDGSDPATSEEAQEVVGEVAAAGVTALIEKFEEERGQGDLAATGDRATIDALNRAQVEVLLLADAPEDARTAWFGSEPIPVSSNAEQLRELGVDDPQEAPLVDVLIRAALGTGAGVALVPEGAGPSDGVGAILRWST